MTRYDLIKSDEYIFATTDCVIRSGQPINLMRRELNEFIVGLRNELLALPAVPAAEDKGKEVDEEAEAWANDGDWGYPSDAQGKWMFEHLVKAFKAGRQAATSRTQSLQVENEELGNELKRLFEKHGYEHLGQLIKKYNL